MGSRHLLGSGLYSSFVTYLSRHLLFTYTPLAAFLFLPFSHLSTRAGELIWDVANVVALVALVAVSLAAARGGRSPTRADWQIGLLAAAPIVLLVLPVRYGLELGQINVVLVLMVVTDLTMVVTARGIQMPRGVLVGLAAAVKLTPLVFVPFLLATRQWRTARNAVVTFAAATAGMALLAPADSWKYFTQYEFDVSRVGDATITNNQTLRAALTRAGLASDHVLVGVLLVVALVAGIALAAVAYRRSSVLLGVLVCAATGLMVSPISWIHHFVWCVPFGVWLVAGADRPRRWMLWAGVAAVVFMVIPPAPSHAVDALWYVRENAYVVATLAFVALTGVMLWRRTRRPPLTSSECGDDHDAGRVVGQVPVVERS
jgi:alpha-1,2-mannosyltransferase